MRPGLEVLLSDSLHLVRGRRVGLITNHTGVDRAGRSGIDRLHEAPELELVALYAPEHGLRGTAGPGARVDDGRDPATGLPVHSLYGEVRRPTPAMLDGVEVLLFDMQDIGARYYTYLSTMSEAMAAAAEAGVPFVVLDRPNPIGGRLVQGNVLDTAFASFVGLHPVPMRHGLTPGEMARLIAERVGAEGRLRVVPAEGWRREAWFDATGLPWTAPSPNMPTLESAAHYPGTCLFEGTNLSVGRGTDAPFRQLGAPWLDGEALARRLRARALPGVRVEAATFRPVDPDDGKYDGEEVRGIRLTVTDREAYDPTRTAVAALLEARRLAGEHWSWRPAHFDRLAGTDRLRTAIEAGRPYEALLEGWDEALAAFRELREPYLIYPSPGGASPSHNDATRSRRRTTRHASSSASTSAGRRRPL